TAAGEQYARGDDGIADHVLEVGRGQRHGRVQYKPHHRHEDTAGEEIAILEQRELDERAIGREGMREEVIETGDGDRELGDDLAGFEPAELLAAVERDLKSADRDGQRGETEPVE